MGGPSFSAALADKLADAHAANAVEGMLLGFLVKDYDLIARYKVNCPVCHWAAPHQCHDKNWRGKYKRPRSTVHEPRRVAAQLIYGR